MTIDTFTYLRQIGFSGTLEQMAEQLRRDTTKKWQYSIPLELLTAEVGKELAKVRLEAASSGNTAINIRSFGAAGDGIVDDTAAIQAACDYAYSLSPIAGPAGGSTPGPVLYGQGVFKTTSTITIRSACDLSGATFNCYQTTGTAVQVGTTSATTYSTRFLLPQLYAKAKTVAGWAQVVGTVGVKFINLWDCWLSLPYARGFETNFWGSASGSTGSGYNRISIGFSMNGKTGLLLSPAGGSWINRNSILSGTFQHNLAEGPATSGVSHIKIGDSSDNTFEGLSIESAGIVQWHLDCAGTSNVFENCRWENDEPNPTVVWRSGSAGNVIRGGVQSERIVYTTDSGAGLNYGAATPLAAFATASRPASIGIGGLAFDPTIGRPIFSADGVIVKTIAVQEDIVDQLSGVGDPEGVYTATVGSIYTRTDSGIRMNHCKYPISDTVAAATGWKVSTTAATVAVGSGCLTATLTGNAGERALIPSAISTFVCTPSTAYTVKAEVRSSISAAMQINVRYYDSSSVYISSAGVAIGASTATNASTFTTLASATLTSPVNAAYVYVHIGMVNSALGVLGDTFDVKHVMFEESQSSGAYIDGSLTGTGITYAWTGTAQASTSTAEYTTRPISYVKTGTGDTGWKALAPAGGVSVPADATDPGTTMTLANALRGALLTSGIVS